MPDFEIDGEEIKIENFPYEVSISSNKGRNNTV
jgi:hypothetical protein